MLSEEQRIKAQTAILYIACGEPGAGLVDCVTEIVKQLEPTLFCSIKDLVAGLGEEMTPALETTRQNHSGEEETQRALTFLTAMSYMRTDNYAKAITLLEEIADNSENRLSRFVYWALALCHVEKEEYDKANDYYSQSKMADCPEKTALFIFWRHWGWCNRLQAKYEQSLIYFQKSLAIAKKLKKTEYEANILYNIGRLHQDWDKYEQAIEYHHQSRDLYEQLRKEKDVGWQWDWLASCYRKWGKYEQALECQQQRFRIHQALDDTVEVANAYRNLGRIYQAWSKYEQAIAHYEQSRDLYEQLGKEKSVATQLYNLTSCYREWGKYEHAEECQQQCLRIHQNLDDQSSVAVNYYQLGRIYQAWGKYEQAIAHYQQSRDLYEQLGKDKDVANQWGWLSNCYRDWGKYEQAMECRQQYLRLHQSLENQSEVALSYYQLGRIYQTWGKYEQAIAHFQQSRELYEQLDLKKNVANQWSNIANCHRDLKDYTKAIEYYQQSRDLHQQLGQDESVARRCRQIAYTQRLLAKNTPDTAEASNLLTQAEQNIHQAIQINTASDYKGNLAYDYTTLGLLCSERLRLLPPDDSSLPEQIAQFEDYYNTGLTYLTELGQTVDRAEETLDMARAYLEVNALENLDRAEALAQESLQIFQDYNRRTLEAAARKLLGEIYLKRAQRNQPNAEATAHQFLSESLQIYRELDLTQKAAEVEQLMLANSGNGKQQ